MLMAHWISSKLKAAETLLQQIDQQAAESLGKNEKPRSDNQLGVEISSGTAPETKPAIKDQLKKKPPDNTVNQSINHIDKHNLNVISRNNDNIPQDDGAVSLNSVSKRNSSGLTESDWTELLSVPDKRGGSGGGNANWNSSSALGIRGLKKDGKKVGNFGSGLEFLADGKSEKGRSTRALKSSRKSNVGLENNDNADNDERANNVGDVMPRTLTNQSPKSGGGGESDQKNTSSKLVADNDNVRTIEKLNGIVDGQKQHPATRSSNKDHYLEIIHVSHERKLDVKMQLNDDETLKSGMSGRNGSGTRVPSLPSDGESNSETDTSSASDSEVEREREERRKRRQQILAERAAAKAVKAIQERENLVARLEGEKQSLEKILEERAKQEVQEASELQTSMMEIMEAVELEKQKHNNTRMEALARLAKLESENADLAKSLANLQKSLEVEVDHIAELRQQIDLEEATHEELQRKISSMQQNGDKLLASKGVEFALEMLEAEYFFIIDKMGRMQEKAKTLESSIEATKSELEYPSEVEIELKRRLSLLTDHLIQKQAQVETLSSEKATLLFRIEAVSRLLYENKSMTDSADTQSAWELSNSKLRPLLKQRIQSGQRHFGSLVQQLDSLFCAGAVFLRRNSTARTWSLVYILCLHLWVIYILMSHSPVSDDFHRSGAVVSLESINNTGGI